ncbi:MAG TPA: hypothetical protein VF757_01505 [Sphingomicrobium sp.]
MIEDEALRRAADAAIDYRNEVSSGASTAVAEYAEILSSFEAPLPEGPTPAP